MAGNGDENQVKPGQAGRDCTISIHRKKTRFTCGNLTVPSVSEVLLQMGLGTFREEFGTNVGRNGFEFDVLRVYVGPHPSLERTMQIDELRNSQPLMRFRILIIFLLCLCGVAASRLN